MAEPTGNLIANREAKSASASALRNSVLRYLAAWMVAVISAYWVAPQIGGWGGRLMSVVLCGLASGAAVLVAFALGLVLRIRAMGRDAWAG